MLIWSSPTRRFLSPSPEVAVPQPRPRPTVPRCGPLSTARPLRWWAAGAGAGKALAVPPRRASQQLVCPGYRRPPVASVQAKPGCKTPCKGCRACGHAGRRRIAQVAENIGSCVIWGSFAARMVRCSDGVLPLRRGTALETRAKVRTGHIRRKYLTRVRDTQVDCHKTPTRSAGHENRRHRVRACVR